jgi:monoamine oxidase
VSSTFDVAIVGAGAAGLAAAHEARERGLEFVVLEAKNRIGGRAFTESASFGVPFDHGCHWLHSASRNPFTAIARELGCAVGLPTGDRRMFLGGRWATDVEQAEWEAFYLGSVAAIEAAGEAGRDVSLADVVDRDSRWTPYFDRLIATTEGVDPDLASTLDFVRYADTFENWPVRDGYGALIARWGAGVPVELSTPVERIVWSGREVELRGPRGTVHARTVILTVSLGVLEAGSIAFEPALPAWKRDAIEALQMGPVDKIALGFAGSAFEVPDGTYAPSAGASAPGIGFQLRPFGQDLAIGWVAGRDAVELERAGEPAAIDFALERLVSMFGTDLRDRFTHGLATRWAADPDMLGSYSSARPGRAHLRGNLATPIDGRLFFAGEAASLDWYSTAHGAYVTGIAAAQAVASVLGSAA